MPSSGWKKRPVSSDDQRVSTDELLALAQPVHVDTLETWGEAPWSQDVGTASVRSDIIGQVSLILTHGPVCLWGEDTVTAERLLDTDGGMVPAVDLAAAGFSRTKAEAVAVSLFLQSKRATVDDVLMAEVAVRVFQEDEMLAAAAGFDGDDVDAMIERINADAEAGLFDDDEVFGAAGRSVECPSCGAVFET